MKLKHDLVVDSAEPFANCKLDRKKYALILTSIVGSYADGFVLAINNVWGTGKTTFVKMWQNQLFLEGYQTLYFNAWENDFESNPLIAFISELKTLSNFKPEQETKYKSLLQKGSVLAKKALPVLFKAVAAKYVDTEVIIDLVEKGTEGITEIFEDELKDYAAKKKGLREFKTSLSEFVALTRGEKPIVFIIDELDRCKPSYAVELLEQLKHFFSVSGIVFVLSVDKVQLGHAIRGFYGSDQIDANEYLRRFIDVEYSIPEPSSEQFCNYMFDYFGFADFFSTARQGLTQFNDEKQSLIVVASKLFEGRVSLRQQEKIFAHARLGLKSFKENNYVFPGLYWS